MFTYSVVKPSSFFGQHGIMLGLKANDRRKIVRLLYGEWFKDNGLKLGRDYGLDWTQTHRDVYTSPHMKVTITIKDPTKALLFKLTWGGM